jgi:hypothetical protein
MHDFQVVAEFRHRRLYRVMTLAVSRPLGQGFKRGSRPKVHILVTNHGVALGTYQRELCRSGGLDPACSRRTLRDPSSHSISAGELHAMKVCPMGAMSG